MTAEAITLILGGAAVGLMILERQGVPVTLQLSFKGDLKRETRWFAQYGQAACTVVVGILLWQAGEPHRGLVVPMLVAVFGASLAATMLKRLLGRVRPNRPQAGQFLGPTWRHANYRESFPSSHSACAVALTVALAWAYPQWTATLWAMALICAGIRYFMDAHWPSDVLGGIALGYGFAHATMTLLA